MSIQERYDEFLRRANAAARDLEIEVTFTTDEPCVEIHRTDDISEKTDDEMELIEWPRYLCTTGCTSFGVL
jgi:hypothetical protein